MGLFSGPKTGFIIDLDHDWQEVSFGLYIANNVPFYYHWTALLAAQARFSELNPQHDIIAFDVANDQAVMASVDEWLQAHGYDFYLQKIDRGTIGASLMKPSLENIVRNAIIDFEGWSPRLILRQDILDYAHRTMAFHDDAVTGTRTFYRHMPIGPSPTYEDDLVLSAFMRERLRLLYGPGRNTLVFCSIGTDSP